MTLQSSPPISLTDLLKEFYNARSAGPLIGSYSRNTPGTATANVPENCNIMIVEIWGAGGSGTDGNTFLAGGGGGSGAFASSVFYARSLGDQTLNIVVGGDAAGSGGTATTVSNGGLGISMTAAGGSAAVATSRWRWRYTSYHRKHKKHCRE